MKLSGRHIKNEKDTAPDLAPVVVKRLRPLLVAVTPGEKVWGGSGWEREADMIRDDLAEAALPAVVNGKEVVFHSLRHTFGTMVGWEAPSAKVMQEMMRHSSPLLSIGRYGHTEPAEKSVVAHRLPLPGSANASPLAIMPRSDLEQLAETLADTLYALAGTLLVVPRVVPEREADGDNAGRSGTDAMVKERKAA